MRISIKRLLCVAVLFAGTAPAWAQDATEFGDKLGFMPVADINRAFIGGTGEVSASLSGNLLEISGEFEGLRGNATEISVHSGPPGQSGEQFASVEVDSTQSGAFSGEVELSEEQVALLQDNSVYVVVRTERSENGELRGWLTAQDE